MTTEEKELLLKDLSARLPYGVKCKVSDDFKECRTICGIFPTTRFCVSVEDNCGNLINNLKTLIEDVKPYLFPLSSMTEEQEKNYHSECEVIITEDDNIYIDTIRSIDWLNKNHFDYRGLIGRGLAIDATNVNIYS